MAGLRDFLFPAACAVCRFPMEEGNSGLICRICWARAEPLVEPICERCGHPRLSPLLLRPETDAEKTKGLPACRWCDRLPPWVRAARSAVRVDRGTGGRIVHALKYQGWKRAAKEMAHRMARLPFPPDVTAERTAVVAVPLGKTRLRERGYNQAGELAAALAAEWRIPFWEGIVERSRNTRSQVRLTPEERARNVAGAFTARANATRQLRGAHVILLDDVITTAATLNAAAAALVAGGARIISYVSFGRAPDPGARTDDDFDENDY